MPRWARAPIGDKLKLIQLRRSFETGGNGMFGFDALSTYEFDEETTLEAILFWIGIPCFKESFEMQIYVDHRAKRLYEGDGLEVSVIASHGIHKHYSEEIRTLTWSGDYTGTIGADNVDVDASGNLNTLNTTFEWDYEERKFYVLPRPILFEEGEDIFVHADGNDWNINRTVEYRIILYCSARR